MFCKFKDKDPNHLFVLKFGADESLVCFLETADVKLLNCRQKKRPTLG